MAHQSGIASELAELGQNGRCGARLTPMCLPVERSTTRQRLRGAVSGCSTPGKSQREPGHSVHFAHHFNAAAVQLHYRAHDGKPESGRAVGRSAGSVSPEVAIEDALGVLRRYAKAGILDRIASQVWDMNFDSDTNVVDVAVRRLRAKVDDAFDKK